jgi:hypothetical protein
MQGTLTRTLTERDSPTAIRRNLFSGLQSGTFETAIR